MDAGKRGHRLTERLQAQLMLRFGIVVALLAAVICLLFWQTFSAQVLERTETLLEQSARSDQTQLSTRAQAIKNDALSILSNSTISEYLTYPYRKNAMKAYDATYAFQPVVRWVLTINSQYRRIHFLTANETAVGGSFVSALSDYADAPWVQEVMKAPAHNLWMDDGAPVSFPYAPAPAEDVVTYVLYNSSGRHLVMLDTSAAWLYQQLPLVLDRATGRVLYSEICPEVVGTTLSIRGDALDTVALMGKEYYIRAAADDTLDVLLVACEPKAGVRQQIGRQVRTAALWLLMFVCAAMALLYLSLQGVVQRMKRIRGNVARITRGSYDVAYEAGRGDEIDRLGTDIVAMARQMNQMVNQRPNQQMLLREAEFRALEQQINPHFIFNMLQTMQMIAEMNDQQELADMIAKFGRMVRYNLYASMNVPLSQELGNVRDYLELQKVLYNDELDVRVDMDGVPQTLGVPRLLLQPLVENAITHGHAAGKVLHVLIQGVVEGDRVRMRIVNDGKRLTEERERTLSSVLSEVCENPGSVDGANARENLALINIQKRLLIRFGPACRMHIFNDADGVTVTFDLPLQEEMP